MVEYAGFQMPVQYTSILEEHRAVREAAGLFDVSHMGQIALRGPGAVAAADRLLSRRTSTLAAGRVRYALMCNGEGGVVDDVTAYRIAEDALFLCVNAANVEKDYRWIVRHSPADAGVRNTSEETGLLALQGPCAARILAGLAGEGVAGLRRWHFDRVEIAGCTALASRTGYTGGDGFEIYLGVGDAQRVFEALLEAGAASGLLPCGLGARDTLRLEAALPLYGHELDDTTSPLEAGLGRFVDLAAPCIHPRPGLNRRLRWPSTRSPTSSAIRARTSGRGSRTVASSSASRTMPSSSWATSSTSSCPRWAPR